MFFSNINRGFGYIRGIASNAGRGLASAAWRGAHGATQAAFRYGGERAGMRVGGAMTSGAIFGQRARMFAGRMMPGVAGGRMNVRRGVGADRRYGIAGGRLGAWANRNPLTYAAIGGIGSTALGLTLGKRLSINRGRGRE